MNFRLLLNGFFGFLFALIFLLSPAVLFAQTDEAGNQDMPASGSVKCKPDSLNTPYEKFKSDTITQKQVSIWYSFGSEEFKHSNYKKAIPYFWKVLLNTPPKDPLNLNRASYSKVATGYFELAKSEAGKQAEYIDSTLIIIYRGLEHYPDYPNLHHLAGTIFNIQGNVECAILHFEALVRIYPDNIDYLKTLSSLLFRTDDERCIEIQQKIVNMQPDNSEASSLLIQYYQHFQLDPIEPIKKAFENDPTNIANALRYGKEALIIGQYDEALKAFNAVLKVDPNHLEALEQKAKSYEGLNKTTDAINAYKEILKIDPKNVGVLCSVARGYLHLNNFSQAQAQINQAKRIDPGNGEPYMVMADIYINAAEYCSNKRGENNYNLDDKLVFERAVKELEKAERDPNFRASASTRRNGLKDFVRTKEDIFMNPRENLKDNCYSWIQ